MLEPRGNIFDAKAPAKPVKPATPPGDALLRAERLAETRQAAGKNPSVTPGQLLRGSLHAVNALVNPPPTYTVDGKVYHRAGGAPVFTGATAALTALAQLPSLLSGARAQAVKIAHPSSVNPPSLGQNVTGLLSGVFGIPRMGVSDDPRYWDYSKGRPEISAWGRSQLRATPTPKVPETPAPVHARARPAIPGEAPRVPRGTQTPQTGGELGQQVREGLRGAKAARTQQNQLYAAERASRAGAAQGAMDRLGGVAGYQAALGELKGELPKLKFGGFENFDQAGLDALYTHIQQHPTLRPFEKIRAQTALGNVINGNVPTPSDLKLMEQVFGREVRTQIAASIPTWEKAKRLGIEVLNVPRSLMASFDLSAPFRQGLVAGVSHPVLFAKNFAPMTKALVSEKAYANIMDDIASRPTFPKMQEAGLALTDMGRLETREEQFMSNLAERIPVVGRGVRGSGRAYTGFLNKMRADVFDSLLRDAAAQGRDIGDKHLTDSIARFVNSATGRGDLGAFQGHAVTLNTLLFSPRLLWSRLNFLNPAYYARLDPFARKAALKAALSLVGTVGTVLYLSKLGGADVVTDPRNADFAKMRFGNTRIDVLGGFQQPVRLLAQLGSGKVISSTTGKTLSLGPQGPGKLSRRDIFQRFVEAKLAPVPSFVNDVAKGTGFTGQPLAWGFSANNPAFQRMLPLLGQDAYQLYQDKGSFPLAAGGYALGSVGIGLQTYGPKAPSASTGNPFDAKPRKGGGNVFDASTSSGGSSGGSNIFDK